MQSERLIDPRETQRGFTRCIHLKEGGAKVVIDDKFGIMTDHIKASRASVVLIGDKNIPIIRESMLNRDGAFTRREQEGKIQIGVLVLTMDKKKEVVYYGDDYKISFLGVTDRYARFSISSVHPVQFEAIPENVDLPGLLRQRSSKIT